jgi:hypothetical protein
MARGCGILGVIIVIGLCLLVVVATIIHLGTEPGSIHVQATVDKRTVAVGDTFTIEVTVENVDLNSLTITGVGLDEDLLKGAAVQASDPAYRAVKARDYPVYGTWDEFTLDHELAGGRTLILTLTLTATQAGSYSGDVTVWIDSDLLGIVPLARAGRASVHYEVQ